MGKIVKFCEACDEGFAEKFGFCPNCGQKLNAFEMNPVVPGGESLPTATPPVPEFLAIEPAAEKIIEPVLAPEENIRETQPVAHEPQNTEAVPEHEILEVPMAATAAEDPIDLGSVDEPVSAAPATDEEEVIETEPEAAKPGSLAANAAAAPTSAFFQTKPMDADRTVRSLEAEHKAFADDGNYYITVIEEKNAGQRNVLLLGSFAFMVLMLTSALVYNLFTKDLEVGAINDDLFNAVLVDELPADIEETPQLKDKKDAGGGGGGGRQDKEETTQGDLADQTKNPIRPPDANTYRSNNPDFLKMPPASTEGDRKFPKQFDRYGDPNGRFTNFSNGTGSGGGQGSGTGTGQGSGRGTGAGSGDGSGSGGGLGDGNGNGRGSGNPGGGEPPPPPKKVGPTVGLNVTSKPKPTYTDAARTAGVQGTVTLRVTFQANGTIGAISPVKGLPNGLTEQAIAAARRMSFTPKMVDGVPQSVTKLVEYAFNIY